MTLADQVYAQAVLLAGGVEPRQEAMLRMLSGSITNALAARLRTGLTPEDCKADFIAAASLYALATLTQTGDQELPERFTAGEITVSRRSGDAAANCLRNQAELMLSPYLQDSFSFAGV